MLYVNPVAVWAQLCCCKLFLAQAHFLAQAPFRLKHSRGISDAPSGGSLVAVGWAAATQVSEPPRGCRWETDMNVHIGLRMLTRLVHEQLLGFERGLHGFRGLRECSAIWDCNNLRAPSLLVARFFLSMSWTGALFGEHNCIQYACKALVFLIQVILF